MSFIFKICEAIMNQKVRNTEMSHFTTVLLKI